MEIILRDLFFDGGFSGKAAVYVFTTT